MIRPAKLRCALAMLAVGSFLVSAANAHDGCGSPFAVRGYGVSGSLYGLGRVPVPPYFALHPPVYYSVPVPRTYGYSPFAYPAEVQTPEIAPAPQEVLNPYVPQPAEKPASEKKEAPQAKKTSGRVAAAPLLIDNPFVARPSGRLVSHAR